MPPDAPLDDLLPVAPADPALPDVPVDAVLPLLLPGDWLPVLPLLLPDDPLDDLLPVAPADPALPLAEDDCEEDDDDDEEDETGGMLPGLPALLDDELLLSGLLSGSEPHPAATIATTLIRYIAARCIAVTPTAYASQTIIARGRARPERPVWSRALPGKFNPNACRQRIRVCGLTAERSIRTQS